jgi:hypothetical protein
MLVTPRTLAARARAFAAVLAISLFGPAQAARAATVSVNGDIRYQKLDGFGASVNAHSWDAGAAAPALSALDTMGVRIWRVIYDTSAWEATNDDADPAHFNWSEYDAWFSSPAFEEVWSTIGYLNQRGYGAGVMLDFVGPIPNWMGGAKLDVRLKDELVETLVAAAYYGRVRRDLHFGMFAPLNETDWDGIEGPQIGATDFADVMNRIAIRLDTLGLGDLALVGPDTAQGGSGGPYVRAMTAYPKLMAHVPGFATHNYTTDTNGLMDVIHGSSYPDRRGWVSETSSVTAAFSHLEQGVSAVLLFEGYDSVYEHAILAGRGTTAPNDAGPQPAALAYDQGVYTPRLEYYRWEQLFRFVRPGAVRVGVTTNASGVGCLAFAGPGVDELTVVGRNDGGSNQTLSISLTGVGSARTLHAYVTDQARKFIRLPDVSITSGAATFQAPANGMFTLTAPPAAPAAPLPAWALWVLGPALLCAGAAFVPRPSATDWRAGCMLDEPGRATRRG